MKHLRTLMAMAAILICSAIANAQTFEVDGIAYKVLSSTDKTVEVTSKSPKYSGDVVIPATVTYGEVVYSITSIGSQAFYYCSGLTSISIPEGVTSIGKEAFLGCSGLTSITIPEGVTSIGYGTFYGCNNLVLTMKTKTPASIGGNNSFKTILVPVTAYDAYIEAWSSYASKIKVPFEQDGVSYEVTSSTNKTVKVVSREEKYTGDVTIPAKVTYDDIELAVTSIGNYAFIGCSGLTSITIPSSVTSIGTSVFNGCSGLTSITIPSSVTSIGEYAFANCTSITDLYINSIESWFNISFGNTESNPLSSASSAKSLYLNGELVTELEIPEGVTSIGDRTFYYCSGLTSITIPEGVTSIGKEAFNGCSALTSITIPEGVASIGNYAFNGCSGLTSITIPSSVTSIGNYAFYNCSGLTSITISEGVTSIGNYAFNGCSGLTSITIPSSVTSIGTSAFAGCSALTSITIPSSVTSIGNEAFWGCSGITSITIPEGVTSIGNSAFRNCSSLTSITIPSSVTSIGNEAFSYCSGLSVVNVKAETPATISSSSFESNAAIIVPANAYDDYCNADVWSGMKSQFAKDCYATQVVTLAAADTESSLHKALGEEKLAHVVDLKISGTINSYDFMVMRNKMTNLRKLDLSEANVVYNAYEHYTGSHSYDNEFPAYAFRTSKLSEIKLPKTIKSIRSYAMQEVNLLTEIDIPEGVETIGECAFLYCKYLKDVKLPSTLKSIGNQAFAGCGKITNIKLPPALETIGSYAFSSCNLKEIRIPSSVRSIGSSAFSISALKDVYVYTVEPISIAQNTFGFTGQTLHAPKVSYTTYWYDTQWSQFSEIVEFDEPYEYFYLEGDKEIDNSTGAIEGEGDNNPDADMGDGSGLIVGGDINQDMGDVNIEHDGENGGSIIVGGSGEVNAENMTFRITVKGGKWYFFCFPFDIKAENITCENGANYVFRYYDGEERANNGKGGWKNVTSDGNGNFLKAATGYIFQASANDVLCITVKDAKIKKEKKYNELVEHITQNAQDASWNFVGNPYMSYYEVTSDNYSAPITIWNGSSYEAIRPGDDDYHLAPFEAFFVQKPAGTDAVSYDSEGQMTKKQSEKAKAESKMRRLAAAPNSDRKIVNIVLSDANGSDRTRVVFNEKVGMEYDASCDAAKFTTAGMAQLYTLDTKQVMYAINERPMADGTVVLGFTAVADGEYTLSAQRMDEKVLLKDNIMGKIHDFETDGDYSFASQAGTFNTRFTLIVKNGEATGINSAKSATGMTATGTKGGIVIAGTNGAEVEVYNAGGAKVAALNGDGKVSLNAGTYIVSMDGKSVKVTVK